MALTAVQTAFYDTFQALYPGQLADYGTNTLNDRVRNYRIESGAGDAYVIPGRFLVKGTANAQGDPVTTPYGAKGVLSSSVLADVVGILVQNYATTADSNNQAVPVRIPTMMTVAELGSGAIVGAVVPAGVTVADGDPVYLSVSSGTIPVGACTNASGTGLIAVTGATWYGAAAAGTVGRIKL